MANWIDTIYNTARVHSYIGNVSPDQYEARWVSSQPIQLQQRTAEEWGTHHVDSSTGDTPLVLELAQEAASTSRQ